MRYMFKKVETRYNICEVDIKMSPSRFTPMINGERGGHVCSRLSCDLKYSRVIFHY